MFSLTAVFNRRIATVLEAETRLNLVMHEL
jgi:hypothetical protein